MRLIDADELMKDRVENDPVRIASMCAPTAYDVDKVVEWIESERKEAESYGQSSVAIAHEIDIEIVKSGGIE